LEIGKGYHTSDVIQRHETNKTQVKSADQKSFADLGPFDKDLAKFTNVQAQRRFDQR
jgi:hypothetical protein